MPAVIQIYNQFQVGSEFARIPSEFERISVGSDSNCDIPIKHRLIPAIALELESLPDERWKVACCSEKKCHVNGELLGPGDRIVVAAGSTVHLPPYSLKLSNFVEQVGAEIAPEALVSQFVGELHFELLEKMRLDVATRDRKEDDQFIVELEHTIEQITIEKGLRDRTRLVAAISAESVKQQIIRGVVEEDDPENNCAPTWSRIATRMPNLDTEIADLIPSLREQLGLGTQELNLSAKVTRIEQRFTEVWKETSKSLFFELLLYVALCEVKKQTKDLVFGYGPLEDLLRLPTVTEIMVVRRDRIYIEKNGVLECSGRRFTSDEVTETIIKRIVERVGKTIDRSKPLVDARLTDGSRVNAVISPIALGGPCITVRKFPNSRISMAELVARTNSITETAAMFLKAAVEAERNIIVSGGTGTGKTTLLNCLSEFIPNSKRIVTIEDTAELQLEKDHVVRMETKPSNAEGAGEYSIQDLVKNSLRMRPDRIVVGECRGPEALDMLQAMNTGHDGSLTTLHANSPADVQLRLEVLVRMATELPVDAIQRQIASAIHIIVQLKRLKDGSRIVSHITEVVGVDTQRNRVRMKDLFRTEEYDGEVRLMPTGHLPTFVEKLDREGLLDLDVFFR